jgi:DNA-directed RNA polymerase specialized sigma24 family protein
MKAIDGQSMESTTPREPDDGTTDRGETANSDRDALEAARRALFEVAATRVPSLVAKAIVDRFLNDWRRRARTPSVPFGGIARASQELSAQIDAYQQMRPVVDRVLSRSLPRVQALLRQLTPNESAAEDAAQVTAEQAMSTCPPHDLLGVGSEDRRWLSWLFGIAKNVAYSRGRAANRERPTLEDLTVDGRVPPSLLQRPAQEDRRIHADMSRARERLRRRVREGLALGRTTERIPRGSRQLCGTVKARISRARHEAEKIFVRAGILEGPLRRRTNPPRRRPRRVK